MAIETRARTPTSGMAPLNVMLVTDDGDLLNAAAPVLKRAAISIAAAHPDELGADMVLPDALLIDGARERRLGESSQRLL